MQPLARSMQTATRAEVTVLRRAFLLAAAASTLVPEMPLAEGSSPVSSDPSNSAPLGAIRQIRAGVLDIGYYERGPANGPAVVLLHGWPYDVHSYEEVTPLLADRDCRVIVPYLRGHGTTRFLDKATPRAGQQAAVGVDVIALMDALRIQTAVLAGYDWGGRAACVAAALWPERCQGLVSVNSYLIQDIAHAARPIAPEIEAGFWYQYYFQTERGRAGLEANRQEIARLMWTRNSPRWHFDESTFARSAAAFDNPDYVDVVIHSYRHRLGLAAGFDEYESLEKQLAALPAISVPAITLDGDSDGVVPATDGSSTAAKFVGGRQHHVIRGIGHNLPQENPKTFASAVWELVARR